MFNKQKEMLEAIQNLTTTVNKMRAGNVKAAPTCDPKPQGNIVIIGGQARCAGKHGGVDNKLLDSVEVYSLANRTWSKLAPMKHKRAATTAHFYNGRVMVTGGRCDNNVTRSIEHIQIPGENVPVRAPLDALLAAELPFECYGHKTTILNDYMWLVGGSLNSKKSSCSNAIYTKPLHSTDNFLVKCRMPEPLSYHGLEVVDNELLIIGGTTTGLARDIVKTVLSYNIATSELRKVHPLPFPMADMATVKHGDDVIIIGGVNKENKYLNTVFKYNHKKRVCERLPDMKYKRDECAAVISGNKVFVMGGNNSEEGCLSSVECFDLELHVWHELPSMSEAKFKIAAVLVP
ncbi:actin-binding IPP [Paramuricea clavata]|uniref:Actin-binding IPP n=1 Tax=Paramuricea clavata TaxID=317549 RepID=A0A6S7IHT9_PARCT|nr:actin-binding IPP [Paramuricea clavata]